MTQLRDSDEPSTSVRTPISMSHHPPLRRRQRRDRSQRPILVEGEPGCGKTKLADSIATRRIWAMS